MKIKNITTIIACVLPLVTTSVMAKVKTKKPKVVHVCRKNDTAMNILACNIFREACGESDEGMLAVGFVTLNRRDHERFPSSIKKVVYQPKQFSWTNHGTSFKVYDKKQWEKAKSFSAALIKIHSTSQVVYNALDITKGSTYFHTQNIKPYWSKIMMRTVKIDNHVFYRESFDYEKGV